ncbi:glycosyltransferase family 4 protein [Aquabacter spiritensis]|uniref:glycosyltransferase family 4 protein n=1 Tax=Aquabacter spiritensis TaxID=933073 RepID=UPI001A9E911C|nr:glycosyltransferase [Aquabacter spiritensis]
MAAGRGGIARVARATARALAQHGVDVSLLSLLDDAPIRIDGRASTTARGSKVRFVGRSYAAALTHAAFLYDSIGIARAHARIPGFRRPYAVWIHGVEVWCPLPPDRMRALRGADLVLVNSHYTLARVEELHGPLPNARVCWLATEEDAAAPVPAARATGRPTVLMVGRVDRGTFYKGHQEVVAAWPALISTVPDARLVIVGDGTAMPDLHRLVRASPARDAIEIKGFVPEAEMPGIWNGAHVFAMPSRGEGFGLVYAEAMRHGVPVIASRQDAGQEINLDGVTGYNVDLDRPGDLTDRLRLLLTSPDRLVAMGAAGRARWQAHFRYGAFKDRFLEAIG